MAEHFDTIVIGTGGVGSSALYHLANRGQNVLGLDPHPAGHSLGSSHGETRVIRQAYFEHPDYVPLLLRAYELWRELEERSGKQLFVQTGLLQIGRPDGVVLKGVLAAAEQHGLSVESLSGSQVREQYPQFRLGDDEVGVFESTAGYLLVEKCVIAHLTAAVQSDATWKQERVVSWSESGGAIRVETETGDYACDRLIVSAGPWVGELASQFKTKTRILKKHQHWFAVESKASIESYQSPAFPIFLAETDDGIYYGFPSLDNRSIKVAEHSGGVPTDRPALAPVPADATDQSRVISFLREYLPAVTDESVRHESCYYTMTDDEHFIVGTLPDADGILIATGLSGHGFKFTSVLGEALADLAINGNTKLPIGFLSPSR